MPYLTNTPRSLSDRDDEIAQLRSKNQRYAQELSKEKSTNDELRESLYDASRECSRFKIQLKSVAEELEDVQEELDEVVIARAVIKTEGQNQQFRLRAQIEEQADENETLRHSITKTKRTHQEEVADHLEKVATLNKALEEQRTSRDECKLILAELEIQVRSTRLLEIDNAAFRERLQVSMAEKSEVEHRQKEEIVTLTRTLHDVNHSNEILKGELKRSRTSYIQNLGELQTEIKELKSQLTVITADEQDQPEVREHQEAIGSSN